MNSFENCNLKPKAGTCHVYHAFFSDIFRQETLECIAVAAQRCVSTQENAQK